MTLGVLRALCPDCEPGLRARQQLWQLDSYWHLLAVLLPFLIVALVGLFLGRALR